MKNKLVRYLIIMFIFFVIDSILRFYLPSSILKLNLTIVPYVGVMMFDLLQLMKIIVIFLQEFVEFILV